MNDSKNTIKNLLDEIDQLKQKIRKLEQSESLQIHTKEILRENEEKYRLIDDASVDYIYSYDLNGRFTHANPSLVKFFGLPINEILGKTHKELGFPDEICKEWDELHRKVYETNSTVIAETTAPNRNNEIRHYEVILNPLHQFDGTMIGIAGVTRDITERKQAEEEIRASQLIIEGIINAIPVRVFWKDINLIYLGCNKIFAKDAGFNDPTEIIGKDDYQMGWRNQADLYRNDDRQVIDSGKSKLLIEENQTTPDGKTIILLTSKIPLINSKGEIIGVLGTYYDITERKLQEEELFRHREHLEVLVKERTEELEIKNQKLERFNELFVGREFRIKELKDRVKELEEKLK